MSFIKNLFGAKSDGKKAGYFVEFDDSANGKSSEAKPVESKPAETKTEAPAPEAVAPEAPAPEAVAPEAVAPEAPAPEAPAPEAPAKAKANPKKAAKAEIKARKFKPAFPEKAAASATPAPAETTAPVIAKREPEPQTFAPIHLNPATALNSSRRRPGPSLSPFMDMARQVKVPKK